LIDTDLIKFKMEWLGARLPVLHSARPFVPSSQSYDNFNANGQQSTGIKLYFNLKIV